MKRKENDFAFAEERKESLKERLEKLIGGRSVRGAAKDWGLPTSTINNYLHRGTEPALRVIMAIAEAEGVSLEWLACGLNKDNQIQNSSTVLNDCDLSHSHIERKLFEQLSFLTESEKHALVEIFARKGIETVLYLLDEDNIKLLQLDGIVKAKILGLQSNAAASLNDERAKECGSDSEIGAASTSLTGGHKQAV